MVGVLGWSCEGFRGWFFKIVFLSWGFGLGIEGYMDDF